MTIYQEEQELELEALESIFQKDYEKLSDFPIKLSIALDPFASDTSEQNTRFHVIFTFTDTYPQTAPLIEIALSNDCSISVDSIQLINKHVESEYESYIGMPMVYNIIESIREYLIKNKENVIVDSLNIDNDGSMYSDMLVRKEKEKLLVQKRQNQIEKDELNEKKERDSSKLNQNNLNYGGTPVTVESFSKWRIEFLKSITPKQQVVSSTDNNSSGIQNTMTGKQFFLTQNTGVKDVEEGEEVLQNLEQLNLNQYDTEQEEDNSEYDNSENEEEREQVQEDLFLEEEEFSDLDDDEEEEEEED